MSRNYHWSQRFRKYHEIRPYRRSRLIPMILNCLMFRSCLKCQMSQMNRKNLNFRLTPRSRKYLMCLKYQRSREYRAPP